MKLQTIKFESVKAVSVSRAIDLLCQQIWCWGRDIERPEGNWLLERNFERLEPPLEREDCDSIYSLDLSRNQHLILRGFGVFYGDKKRGAIFLPRYEFLPRYTKISTLENLPWLENDLPIMKSLTSFELANGMVLMHDLIKWICEYEETVIEQLGMEYRRSTLVEWKNDRGGVIPAEKIINEWKLLGLAISEESSLVYQNLSS